MEPTNKIAFITLASGKSKRLPDKHLIDINGKPLIKHTTDFVKYINLGFFDYYIITDDFKIKEFAKKEEIKCIMEPPHEKKRDHKNGMRLMRWIHEQIKADIYFMFPATSPIRDASFISNMIIFCINNNIKSATTIYKTDRDTYIHNGSIWCYKKEQLIKEDLIDEYTSLFIDGLYVDIDTKEDIEKFKRWLNEN